MSSDAHRFIRRLTMGLTPVRPLPPPWIRAVAWSGISLPVMGAILLAMGAPATWATVDRRMLIQQVAALMAGLTAAAAAFATTVPGARRWIVLLPLAPLSVWMGVLGRGCVLEVFVPGFSPASIIVHWACLPITILAGAFPAAAIVVMLRRGAPLTPRLTTVLAAVAASGLANFAVRFVHAADASIVVLAWHVVAVFCLSALAGAAGRSLFNWRQLTAV